LIKLNLHEEAFNPQFKYVWQSKADFLVLYGGGGSGKSENAADKVLLRTMIEPGHRMVNFRKVGKTIRVSQWLLLKDKIKRHGMEKLFNLRETEMTLTFKPNGNEILSIGMDDREKIKSLTEPTSFWINEATELDREDFLQLIMRLRGFSKSHKQTILDFNPIDEFHWLREYFFTPAIEDKLNNKGIAEDIKNVEIDGKIEQIVTHIMHSTWRDNNFLSSKDKAKYEMMKHVDPRYYDVYGLGLWGKVGNLVYPNGYTIISKEEYPKTYNEVIYGLDFGYTNPTCLIKLGLVHSDTEKGRKTKVYVDELIYESELTLRALTERMSDIGISGGDTIYADSQDPAKIEQLNYMVNGEGGYLFSIVGADKDVKNGLDFVRTCELYSHEGNVGFNKEMTSYRWKLDARGKPIDGEPIKYNDHAMDAVRYALYTNSQFQELQIAFL